MSVMTSTLVSLDSEIYPHLLVTGWLFDWFDCWLISWGFLSFWGFFVFLIIFMGFGTEVEKG